MIKICTEKDLEGITDKTVYDYIRTLITTIFYANMGLCPDLSMKEIGAIYYVEKAEEFNDYKQFGFSIPITERRFEWLTLFGGHYVDACVIFDNDLGSNIISTKENFIKAGIIDEYYEFD